MLIPQTVFALSSEQKALFDEGIPHYNAAEDTTGCSAGGTTLVGKDNIEKAINFFIGHGLTIVQVAGIIGNLQWESGSLQLNPASVQKGVPDPGHGIAQWNQNGRWPALVKYETAKGADPLSLDAQLDYMWHELSTNYSNVLSNLKKSTTVEDATNQFMGPKIISGGARTGGYENPGIPALDQRISRAKNIAQTYSGVGAQAPTGADSTCAGISGTFVETIKKYAWPTYTHDKTEEEPLYSKAVDAAIARGHDYVGAFHGVDCGGFVTRVFRDSNADKTYNNLIGNVVAQHKYLASSTDKYQQLKNVQAAGDLKLGDIYIAANEGHTYIFTGNGVFPGYNAVSASEGTRAPMASTATASDIKSGTWYRPLFPLN